jgi:hypothetical protein
MIVHRASTRASGAGQERLVAAITRTGHVDQIEPFTTRVRMPSVSSATLSA